jgi:hypothetical protein
MICRSGFRWRFYTVLSVCWCLLIGFGWLFGELVWFMRAEFFWCAALLTPFRFLIKLNLIGWISLSCVMISYCFGAYEGFASNAKWSDPYRGIYVAVLKRRKLFVNYMTRKVKSTSWNTVWRLCDFVNDNEFRKCTSGNRDKNQITQQHLSIDQPKQFTANYFWFVTKHISCLWSSELQIIIQRIGIRAQIPFSTWKYPNMIHSKQF